MPKGYRSVIIAAVGWLIVGAAPQKHTPENATQKAEPGVEIFEYHPPCRRPYDDKNCNLEVQWASANASRESARWALWQFIASAAGILGLVYNLYLTRRAVRVAADATKDADAALAVARRSADAAQSQVEIARDVAAQQLRAYLAIENVSGTLTAHGPQADGRYTVGVRIKFKLINYGQTIAHDIGVQVSLSPMNNGIVPFDDQLSHAERNPFHLAPGATTLIREGAGTFYSAEQRDNPAYIAIGVVYRTYAIEGPRQVAVEYVGNAALPDGTSKPFDLRVVSLSGSPIKLHLRDGRMAGRMI